MFPCLELIIRDWRRSSLSVIRKEGFIHRIRRTESEFWDLLNRFGAEKIEKNTRFISEIIHVIFLMNFVDLKLWILVLWWREEFDQDCQKTPKIVVVLWQSNGKKSIALKYVIFYFRNFWWIIKIFRKKKEASLTERIANIAIAINLL